MEPINALRVDIGLWVNLIGRRDFHGASIRERVPLLAVVIEENDMRKRVHNRKQCCAANAHGTAWSCVRRERMETSLQLQAVAHITCQCCRTKRRRSTKRVSEKSVPRLSPSPNAVKHFCSRIRENSGVFGVAQKSHDFSYHCKPRVSAFQKCLTALPLTPTLSPKTSTAMRFTNGAAKRVEIWGRGGKDVKSPGLGRPSYRVVLTLKTPTYRLEN